MTKGSSNHEPSDLTPLWVQHRQDVRRSWGGVLLDMQLDQNSLVIAGERGSGMKRAAGSVTTIVSISNMRSQS